MSLQDKFRKLINEYQDVYATVYRTQNFKHPFGTFIRNDIVNDIKPLRT